MEMFTLKDLIIALDKGVINNRQFEIKLYLYLKNVYDEAYNNPSIRARLNPKSFNLQSVVDRICIAVVEDPDGFYAATNKVNTFNEIEKIAENSYEIFHCSETKVDLGSIPKRQNKKINISVGLETGTVFINAIGKKKDRMDNDEPIVATYALANRDKIVQIEKQHGKYYEYDLRNNSIDNSVICSRFDPSHMQTKNSSGYRPSYEDNHTNRYEQVGITPQEQLNLYKKYFKDKAPCPHFHFYQKDICYALASNNSSFAININDLNTYIKDLEAASKAKKVNDPLLKYDLGMPYLDIMRGAIVCETSDFIEKTKEILKKYSGKNKYDGMIMLNEMIEKTRKSSSEVLSAASDILCFINNTALSETGSPEKALSFVTSLGNSFKTISSNSIPAKNLLSNRDNRFEEGWEQ